jgi:hypothetical protein
MRQGLLRVFVAIALLVLPGVPAWGEYLRYPPTSSDMIIHEGNQKTVVVQIMNLTPFNIQLKNTNVGSIPDPSATSVSAEDQSQMIDRTRATKKSFMFAPVGLPRLIPGLPPQSFNHDNDPKYYNTQSRPYSMVFSWDDRGGYVEDSWIRWTLKDVQYSKLINGAEVPQTPTDVEMGLWMYRSQPPQEELKSGYFSIVSSSVFAAFHTFALIVEWENPMAWIEEFVALAELSKGVIEFAEENTKPDDGYQMYLASYVIPNPNSPCMSNGTCYPAVWSSDPNAKATDAVANFYAGYEMGYPAGPAEASLVVSTHLLRGHSAPMCETRDLQSNPCPLGSVPILMITVWRASDWLANHAGSILQAGELLTAGPQSMELGNARQFLLQAGAGKIQGLLQHYGRRPVLLALGSIIRELQPKQQLFLREMLRSAASGRLPTKQEREVVQSLGKALQDRLMDRKEANHVHYSK